MQTHQYRLGYRADIEGLRAIAILLVVAAHARVSLLAGGFVGVDVFFVLSGYLISGLLLQEIQQTQTMNLRLFYARRLRRLLPGLLLMLLVAGVLGALLIAPGEQLDQSKAAAAAALWASNLFFAFSHFDYFSAGAGHNLFLHTWSLGVEEQFYLVWPLLLVLVLGAWKPRNGLALGRLKVAMVVVFVASLGLCISWTRTAPQLAFYMMPARAWQFALGALVFLFAGAPAADSRGQRISPHKHLRAHGIARGALGWMGLCLILAAALYLDAGDAYPSWWALLPSVGAAAVLAAGATAPTSGAGRLLALRPMQAIGRVSYGWYLWHWPILLLGATLFAHETAGDRIALVLLSLAIATASYRLLEVPVRRQRFVLNRPGMAIAAALALMVLANVTAVRWYGHAEARMTSPAQLKYELARHIAPIIYSEHCDDWYHSGRVKICAFGPANAPHTAVAFGDSVALQWFPAYAQLFTPPSWRLLVITKSSCPMVDLPIFYPRIGREYTECATWRNAALAKIKRIKPDVVITGSVFTYDYTEDQWREGTARILKILSAAAGHVYIMRSTPVLPFNGPSCLAPRSRLYMALSQRSRCVAPLKNERSDAVYHALTAAAARFDNVKGIDMSEAICPHGQCSAERQGMIVFRDSQHLTPGFAQALAVPLAQNFTRGSSMPALRTTQAGGASP